jgi:hypothetical protein
MAGLPRMEVGVSTDAVVGLVVLVLALALAAGLVLWSRRTINVIAKKGLTSARDIAQELNGNGRQA